MQSKSHDHENTEANNKLKKAEQFLVNGPDSKLTETRPGWIKLGISDFREEEEELL